MSNQFNRFMESLPLPKVKELLAFLEGENSIVSLKQACQERLGEFDKQKRIESDRSLQSKLTRNHAFNEKWGIGHGN